MAESTTNQEQTTIAETVAVADKAQKTTESVESAKIDNVGAQYSQLLKEKELIMKQEKLQMAKQNEETLKQLNELKQQNEKMQAEHNQWLESMAGNMLKDSFKSKGGDDEDFEFAQVLLGLKTVEKPELFLDKDGQLKYKKGKDIIGIEDMVSEVIGRLGRSRTKTADPRMIQAMIKEKNKVSNQQQQNQNQANSTSSNTGSAIPAMMTIDEAMKSGNL